MSAIRAGRILAGFFALTVPLMPVQALFVRFSPKLARTFPNWYHRQVCRLLGIKFTIEGKVAAGRPVLIVSNHTSWLDIPVISAVAPVSFVAKRRSAAGRSFLRWQNCSVPFSLTASAVLRRPQPLGRSQRGWRPATRWSCSPKAPQATATASFPSARLCSPLQSRAGQNRRRTVVRMKPTMAATTMPHPPPKHSFRR